jgi:transcriptional regulator with XRE-family HTH domain
MADPIIERVVALAAERGMALRGLAAAAGLSPQYLADMKRKSSTPSAEAVAALAGVLGVEPAALAADPPAPEAADAIPAVTDQVVTLSILRLVPSPLNPRKTIDPAALAELADSIASRGLLQNLVVRAVDGVGGLFEVVAGERRYRAIKQLIRERRLPASLRAGIPCRIVQAEAAEHLALALL